VCYKKYFANHFLKCAFYCGFEEAERDLAAPSLNNNHSDELQRTTTFDNLEETESNKNSKIPDMPQNQILSEIAQELLTDVIRECEYSDPDSDNTKNSTHIQPNLTLCYRCTSGQDIILCSILILLLSMVGESTIINGDFKMCQLNKNRAVWNLGCIPFCLKR